MYFRSLTRNTKKMSVQFADYKGLDLPKVAEEILLERVKSHLFSLKDHLQQTDYQVYTTF